MRADPLRSRDHTQTTHRQTPSAEWGGRVDVADGDGGWGGTTQREFRWPPRAPRAHFAFHHSVLPALARRIAQFNVLLAGSSIQTTPVRDIITRLFAIAACHSTQPCCEPSSLSDHLRLSGRSHLSPAVGVTARMRLRCAHPAAAVRSALLSRGGCALLLIVLAASMGRAAAQQQQGCAPTTGNASSSSGSGSDALPLFFLGEAPNASARLPPRAAASACGAALCVCLGAAGGDGCGALPSDPAVCRPAVCATAYVACQATAALRRPAESGGPGPGTEPLHLALLEAEATADDAVNGTALFRGCAAALCSLAGSFGLCANESSSSSSGGGSGASPDPLARCHVALRRAMATRTVSLVPTPAPTPAPTPLPTLPVPSAVAPNEFIFRAPGVPQDVDGQARLGAALRAFADTQKHAVIRDAWAVPRSTAVQVTPRPVALPQLWLASVAVDVVVVNASTISPAALAALIAARLADAVADTAAQPPALAAAGIHMNAPSAVVRIPFPEIFDSSVTGDGGLLPMWAIAVTIFVTTGVGAIVGLLFSRTFCRVKQGPSLGERLLQDQGHTPGSNRRDPNDARATVDLG